MLAGSLVATIHKTQTQNYTNNALLYHKHLSQRGTKEEQNELYMGTSKSAEGVGLTELFGEAFKEGMEISTHVQDFDSSSLLSLKSTTKTA